MSKFGTLPALLLPGTAVVLSNDCSAIEKTLARLAKVFLGARVQICDGVADEVEIDAAIAALPAVAGADVNKPYGGGKVRLSEGSFNRSTGFDLDGEIVVIKGQGREETVLNFTCAGPCFKLNRAVNQRSRVTLQDITIYGDDANTTYGVQLASTALHNRIVNVAVYDMLTAGIRGDSGNSQNYFERVFIRGCDKGFDMYGNNNTYVDCLATNASGDEGTSSGFRTSETQSSYHGCFAERYATGYSAENYAAGTSFHGCSSEKCGVGYRVDGSTQAPRAVGIYGGYVYDCTHATDAAVIVNRGLGTVISGLNVDGTDSGKSINILSANAVDTVIMGGRLGDATPVTDAGVRTRIIGVNGYVNEAGGATASVADGGTISHGLATTPTHVVAVGSVAGEFVSVTALGATTFTVAIKGHAGGAGTAQTIYWRAWV